VAATGLEPVLRFPRSNAVLLRQLVEHCSHSRQLAEQLAVMRHTRLTAATPHGQRVRQSFRALLRMHIEATRTIVQLSTKLRLTNSSFRTADNSRGRGDERRATVLPQGPRPWEQ
jgi:hypothetical protein